MLRNFKRSEPRADFLIFAEWTTFVKSYVSYNLYKQELVQKLQFDASAEAVGVILPFTHPAPLTLALYLPEKKYKVLVFPGEKGVTMTKRASP